jgi:hypothetical protein
MKTVFGSALICLFCYWSLLQFSAKSLTVYTQSQNQRNLHVIESFLFAEKAYDFVFAGTSLTQRIDFSKCSRSVFNCSLAGESSLTALGIVSASGKTPKKVFVEINFAEKDLNASLVKKRYSRVPLLSSLFLTKNIPINFFLTQKNRFQNTTRYDRVNESVFVPMLEKETRRFSSPMEAAVLNQRIVAYREIVQTLEARGVAVVFYEMPVHPTLQGSVRAEQLRSEFRRNFPNNRVMDAQSIFKGKKVHTKDGLHLLRSEIDLVMPEIEAMLSS